MADKGYENHLQKKIRQEHFMVHEVINQLEELRRKNSKLSQQLHQQLPVLRKRENDSKILIKEMSQRIKELQMELFCIKNPTKKPPIERPFKKSPPQESLLDRKAVFKQLISDNYPKYKEVVKKCLSLILHIERHSAKSPKERIDTYYEMMGDLIKRALGFIFTKTESQKNESIAEKMVEKWKSSDGKFKQVLAQLNEYKSRQDNHLAQIQRLEASEAQLLANKRGLESKMFAYENSLYLKGSEFAITLRNLLNTPDAMPKQEKRKIQQVLSTFSQLANRKGQKVSRIQSSQLKEEKKVQTQNKVIENSQKRGGSTAKIRKNAPVLKKNIFGYYENPQFHSNQPQLMLTKHPWVNKCTQTISEDLSVLCSRPVIRVTVVDGTIKPQRTRHCCNFYVRLHCNSEHKLTLSTKVCPATFQPKWNDQFLIQGYDFPFFYVQVMSQTKGLKDYSIGGGKIQVTRTQLPKLVNIKNDGQHQGRVRFTITYPKARIYQFVLSSVKLIYPPNYPMPKDILNIKFSINPNLPVPFDLGQKIKYFTDDLQSNNKFLIQEGYEGEIRASFEKLGKKGSIIYSDIAKKEGEKQITIVLDKQWSVILCGVLLLLVSQEDEPQPIQQQIQVTHKYFSLVAQNPILKVIYDSFILMSHIKLPLVFRFDGETNMIRLFKEKSEMIRKTPLKIGQMKDSDLEVEEMSPIVIPNTNFICPDHLQPNSNRQLLRAPKIVYEIKIKMVEGDLPVTLATEQFLFEKILAEVQLKCGDRRFSVSGKDLVQNFYITVCRTFKDVGFIKFKIGYVSHTNMLKQKGRQPENGTKIISSKQLQKLDDAEHYVRMELSTASFEEHSSTADYTVLFEFGTGNESSRKTGNMLEWRELFVLPFQQDIRMKIMQHSLLGTKCIQECNLNINENDLKLKCKFITFGPSYVYLSGIQSIKDVYSIKVRQIHGQLNQEADWIGQIDPYIKFTTFNRGFYCTEKLQGAGSNPVWKNDQFVALLGTNQLQAYVYDDDLIGKDDYLGLCTLMIPDQTTKEIQAVLNKDGKQSQGRLVLTGEFGKILNTGIYRLAQRRLDLPKSVYKVTVFKLEAAQNFFSFDNMGYISCTVDGLSIRSGQFERKKRKNGSVIELDYCIWVKGLDGLSEIELELVKITKSMFSTKQQSYAFARISVQQLVNSSTIRVSQSEMRVKGSDGKSELIGIVHYFVEPVEACRIIYVEGIAQQRQDLVAVSDCGDCIALNSNINKASKGRNMLMYDEKWHVLTMKEYIQSCSIRAEDDNMVNLLEAQSKLYNNWIGNFDSNPTKLTSICLRNQKQLDKCFRTPSAVLLTQSLEYLRSSHPVSPPPCPSPPFPVYSLQHVIVKNTQTNKRIVSEGTFLYLILKWADYQLRIPIFNEGNSNLWVCDRLLSFYRDRPQTLQIVEVIREHEERQKVVSIWQGKFVSVNRSLNKNERSRDLNKQYNRQQVQSVTCGSCFEYKSNRILVSCEFVLTDYLPQIEVLHIVEMHVQIPLSNVREVKWKKSKLKANDFNSVIHELSLQLSVETKGEHSKILGVMVFQVPDADVLAQGRVFRLKNLRMPLIGELLNTEYIHNPHKFQPNRLRETCQITNASCSLSIFHCDSTRQSTKLITRLQELQNFNIIRLSDFTENRSGRYCFTNKYLNENLLTCYSQLSFESSDSSPTPISVPFTTNKAIILIQQIVVDINDHTETFDTDNYFLYLECIGALTKATRIFRLQLTDKEKRKYALPAALMPYHSHLVADHPEDSSFSLKVKAICKKGLVNMLIRKQNVDLGEAVFNFGKWDNSVSDTEVVELRQAKKVGQAAGKEKAMGFINIRYQCKPMDQTQEQFRQFDIDHIILEQKSDELRIECYDIVKERVQKPQGQPEYEEPFQVFYASPSAETPKNENSFEYRMNQSIFIATNSSQTHEWATCFSLHVYDNKRNCLLGKFNTSEIEAQLVRQCERGTKLEAAWVQYQRWSQCLQFNSLTTTILAGSVMNVQPLNMILEKQHQNDNKGAETEPSLPTESQITDSIGQTIVRFKIGEFYGEIEPEDEADLYLSIETSLRVIRSVPIKYKRGQKHSPVYGVHMFQKQLFNTNAKITICDKKWMAVYMAQLDSSQAEQIGHLVFYSYKVGEKPSKLCGTCVYSISLASTEDVSEIKQAQTFVEISNIKFESYKDTELFTQMTPYLTVANKFHSAVGLGKTDLFWKLSLLFPLSPNLMTNIEVTVKDKDLFFDDDIGTTLIVIDPFDVNAQVTGDYKEREASLQHSVLRLEQYTHMYIDVKNKGQLAGRMRVQYRYLLAMPILVLYSSFDQGVKLNICSQLEQMKRRLRRNKYKLLPRVYEEIEQELVQVKISEGNADEFLNHSRRLMSENGQKLFGTNPLQFGPIHRSTIQMLALSGRPSREASIFFVSATKLANPVSEPGHKYKWKISDGKKVAQPVTTRAVRMLDAMLPTLHKHHKMTSLTSFFIYMGESKIKTPESLSVYVMTNNCTVVLIHGINARMSVLANKSREPGAVSVEPIGILIPVVFCSLDEQLLHGDIKVVLHDSETGYSCTSFVSTSQIHQKEFHASTFNQSKELPRKRNGVEGEYLILSRVYRTDKYELEQRFKQEVGIMFSNMHVVSQLQELMPEEPKLDSGRLSSMLEIYSHVPMSVTLNRWTIKVRIVKAILLKDVELLSKMDPYCQLYLRNGKDTNYQRSKCQPLLKTHTEHDKGKFPIWNEEIYITLDSNDKDAFIDFVINDQQVTFDRTVAYASISLLQYIQKADNQTDFILSLVENQKNKSGKAGDLYISISEPIQTFILFTSIRVNSHLEEPGSIDLYYQQLLPTQSPNSPMDTQDLGKKYTPVRVGEMYPISTKTHQVRFIFENKSTKKVFYVNLTLDEMFQRMYRADSRIRIVQQNVEVGYFLCEKNAQLRAKSMMQKWEKAAESYGRRETQKQNKLQELGQSNEFNFILDIKDSLLQQHKGMFVLEASEKKKQLNQDENDAKFILPTPCKVQEKEKGLFVLQDYQEEK